MPPAGAAAGCCRGGRAYQATVGTALTHFGITTDQVIEEFGLPEDRVMELARQGVTCAPPNLLLGYEGTFAPCLHTPASLLESEAAITAMATSAIMMVQTALTSGFTPRRTSE